MKSVYLLSILKIDRRVQYLNILQQIQQFTIINNLNLKIIKIHQMHTSVSIDFDVYIADLFIIHLRIIFRSKELLTNPKIDFKISIVTSNM